jgi:hypothetical protein
MAYLTLTPEQVEKSSNMFYADTMKYSPDRHHVQMTTLKGVYQFNLLGGDQESVKVDSIILPKRKIAISAWSDKSIDQHLYYETNKVWGDAVVEYARLFLPMLPLSFEQKLIKNYYRTPNIELPKKPDYAGIVEWLETEFVGTKAQLLAEIEKEKAIAKAKYDAKMVIYNNELLKLEGEFITDLLDHHGVTDNPKAKRCYGIAREFGQDNGFMGVAESFDQIVELIK